MNNGIILNQQKILKTELNQLTIDPALREQFPWNQEDAKSIKS